jgi:hypothetical protein
MWTRLRNIRFVFVFDNIRVRIRIQNKMLQIVTFEFVFVPIRSESIPTSPSPDGSFFPLATFQRLLFRLTEESVALALESCLGGRVVDFHIKLLSNNHFQFSVFPKDVGLQISKLRRVITNSFDIYFHIWRNGTTNWAKEKRAWEIEQEKEWTYVLSKKTKKSLKKQAAIPKWVLFVDVLEQPPKKQSVEFTFGSFTSRFHLDSLDIHPVFSSSSAQQPETISHDHNRVHRAPDSQARSKASSVGPTNSNSNLRTPQRAFFCRRCFSKTHDRLACSLDIVCAKCFRPGHIASPCRVLPWPKKLWLPKSRHTQSEPSVH